MTTIDERLSGEIELSSTQKKKMLILICSVLFISVMNGTMFMIAIPDIAISFSLMPSEVSWVVTGYIILFAVGSLMYGKLADIYPLKTLLTIGLSLFAAGSILGFFAPNFLMVVVSRMLQATGASSILALVFIIPLRYFPEERGRVLGIVSSTMAFGAGIGPVIGGFVAGFMGWQFLFLFSALVLIAVPFFRMWMPKEERRTGKVDIIGAIFIATAVASLILYITLLTWWYIIISIGFFLLFGWRIFNSDNPFIQPALFRHVPYRTTIIASFFANIAMFGMMFMIPLMLSEVNGLNALYIGLTLFPGAMAAAYIGKWAGVLTDRQGGKRVAYLAFILMILGFFLLSTFIEGPAWTISLIVIISYIAFPFLQTSTVSLLSDILPRNEVGVGMGIYNLFNFMSGAFGASIIGKVLDFDSKIIVNPFAIAQGEGIMYSNIFIGLVILMLLNGSFFYLTFKKFTA